MEIECEPILTDRVIFAPEGFLDQRYQPILEHNEVNIIEMRVLADGPVFQIIQRRPVMQSYQRPGF